MASETVLITGANTGIGFQIVRALCKSEKTYNVVVGGRSPDKVRDAISAAEKEFPSTKSKLFPVQIDIESDESIDKAVDEIKSKFGKLDVLINNAGAEFGSLAGQLTERELWNKSWDVNTAGTQVTTSKFVPLLLESANARILFITSGTSTLEGSTYQDLMINRSPPKGWPKQAFSVGAYRSAKAGLNMVMREWTRILREDGVKVWAISPGFLATGLGGNQERLKQMGAQDPEIAGPYIVGVVEGQRDDDVGKVLYKDGLQPW